MSLMTIAKPAVLALMVTGLALAQFVPADFKVPQTYVAKSYKLMPLRPGLEKQDYAAYMSSIEHLQKTFSGPEWPTKSVTMADALKDVEGEKSRFDARKSFTYSVLTLDGKQERGCVYIKPSKTPGHQAKVVIWVTKAEFDRGFQEQLEKDIPIWIKASWPFTKVEYGRKF